MFDLKRCLTFLLVLTSTINLIKSEELTEDNWRELLEGHEWMIEFFAPWCPACNRLQPVWNEFTKKASELNIRVGAVDLTKYPSLSGLFSVTSLPTIYHVKDKQYRVYEGNRDLDDLVEFVRDQKWQELKPVNPWLTPDSLIMQLVSYLFKITIYFKDLYTTLNETYGLPNWLVLALFVLATIVLGLCLGIILIICIDYVCWPRKYEQSKDLKDDELPSEDLAEERREEDKESGLEEGEEELDDDKQDKQAEKDKENQMLKKRKVRKD